MNLLSALGVGTVDDNKTSRQLSGPLNRVVSVLAIAMSLYHVYAAVFGVPEWLIHRPLHVVFALSIGFLTCKSGKRKDTTFSVVRDILFALASISVYLYILYNFERFSYYQFMITKLTTFDFFMIILTFVLILELTRRTNGWSIILVALVFVLYTLNAKHMPAVIRGAGVSVKNYLSYMFCVSDGLFGSTVNISSTYVFLFVLFGAFLEKSGVGEYFINFAMQCTAGLRGGAAKSAILASGLFGSISGSAVANVYATGTFTIPLMKKSGFKPVVAGATEAVASSGGAIMPPVMGSSAFLMADFLGVSYPAICKAALIPAVLYYLSLWFMMDFEAVKTGMKPLPKTERAAFDAKSFLRKVYLVAPIVVIIAVILSGKSVFRAAFLAIVTTIIVGVINDRKRMSLKGFLAVLDEAGRSSVSISIALTCASIVVGTINLTGIGLKLTSLIVRMAGDSLWLVMLLTMILTIILGMGLPTPAAYMLVAVFAPSALQQFGVAPITSHMFCFYYAAFSTITPPVAMAAYAGGNLAGAPAAKTGFTACRLGLAAYVIPWIFVISSPLMMEGSLLSIVQATVTSIIGVYALASGAQGLFLERRLPWFMRIVAFACALCMIVSGTVTDLIGIALLACLVAYVKFFAKDKAVPA